MDLEFELRGKIYFTKYTLCSVRIIEDLIGEWEAGSKWCQAEREESTTWRRKGRRQEFERSDLVVHLVPRFWQRKKVWFSHIGCPERCHVTSDRYTNFSDPIWTHSAAHKVQVNFWAFISHLLALNGPKWPPNCPKCLIITQLVIWWCLRWLQTKPFWFYASHGPSPVTNRVPSNLLDVSEISL